jgi:hypothetical protein
VTEFLNKSFSVGMAGDQQYRDNWEATFGKRSTPTASKAECTCYGSTMQWKHIGNCPLNVPAAPSSCPDLCGECGKIGCEKMDERGLHPQSKKPEPIPEPELAIHSADSCPNGRDGCNMCDSAVAVYECGCTTHAFGCLSR